MPIYVFENRTIHTVEGIAPVHADSDYYWPEEVVIIYPPDTNQQIDNSMEPEIERLAGEENEQHRNQC